MYVKIREKTTHKAHIVKASENNIIIVNNKKRKSFTNTVVQNCGS